MSCYIERLIEHAEWAINAENNPSELKIVIRDLIGAVRELKEDAEDS